MNHLVTEQSVLFSAHQSYASELLEKGTLLSVALVGVAAVAFALPRLFSQIREDSRQKQ